MNGPASDPAVPERWVHGRAHLQDRLEVIGKATTALVAGTADADQQAAAERSAAELVDLLASLHMAGATEHAQALEARFAAGPPFGKSAITAMCDHLVALTWLVEKREREITDRPAHERPRGRVEGPSGPVQVWYLGEGHGPGASLGDLFETRGWNAHFFQGPQDAEPRLDQPLDHLIVTWEGDTERIARFVRSVRHAHPDADILVIGEEADLQARIDAVQAGADRYLPHDTPPDRLIAAVEGSDEKEPPEVRVLVVDDDPDTLVLAKRILGTQGYGVCTEDDPGRFWTTLEEQDPDLIVLDLDMPHHDGVALCRALRADAYWASTPVLILATRQDTDLEDAVWQAGADDLLVKPLRAMSFLLRIRNRLNRNETIRRSTGKDPDLGTPDTARGRKMAHRVIALAQREAQPASIALLAPPPPDGPTRPHEVIRQIVHDLRRSLREDDVIYPEGEHIAIISYAQGRQALGERIIDGLRRSRAVGVAPVVAVTGLGVDGDTLERLFASAERLLDQEHDDGAPVRMSGEGAVAVERPDVAIVEEDETVAALLRQALGSIGLDVLWIDDGRDAVARLTGAAPQVRPAVILLDVNLPGFDGLSLLRRLRDDAVLERTNVIMLSARSLEVEVVEALRLGADDHIAKPFSLPVLLERVRRSLEA